MSDLLFEMQSLLLICAKGDKNRLVAEVKISLRLTHYSYFFFLIFIYIIFIKIFEDFIFKICVHYSKMNIIKVIKSYDKYNVNAYNFIFLVFLANYICAIKQEKKHIFAIVLISKERTHYQDKIYTIILSLVK